MEEARLVKQLRLDRADPIAAGLVAGPGARYVGFVFTLGNHPN